MTIQPHPENSIESPLMPVINPEKIENCKNFKMFKAQNFKQIPQELE